MRDETQGSLRLRLDHEVTVPPQAAAPDQVPLPLAAVPPLPLAGEGRGEGHPERNTASAIPRTRPRIRTCTTPPLITPTRNDRLIPPKTTTPFPLSITTHRRANDACAKPHRAFPTANAARPQDSFLFPTVDIAPLQALTSAAAERRPLIDAHRRTNRSASIAVRSATPRLPKRNVLPGRRDIVHKRRIVLPHHRNPAPADAQHSRPTSHHIPSRSERIPSNSQRRTSGTQASPTDTHRSPSREDHRPLHPHESQAKRKPHRCGSKGTTS
jgi:hypothetical protein